ncbi:MAG TPA: patatin-like phospholipase family protein [Caulobacteraceae bacterium]|jgi:NTE family protein|nr:patatin-like phospholipase family protein [Caulobacteraceae bacterium]
MTLLSRKKVKEQAAPAPHETSAPKDGARPISIGLQGGGSHGAFEWGVLDRILEDGRLTISAITAASAGAMNALALASGMARGGPDEARKKLEELWRGVNQSGGRNVFGDSGIWTAALNPQWLQANPFYRYYETMLLNSSPYEFNPFNLNPLRDVLTRVVDFEAVRAAPMHLFISATDVLKGKERVFTKSELDVDTVLASSALPYLFQAVEVKGEPYWDGGYLANPPLWPLYYEDTPRDILIVMLNPFRRKSVPRAAGEIVDRLNEITFNAALTAELRAVAFVHKLIEDGMLTDTAKGRYRHMLIHAIEADGHLDDLPLPSKFDTEWSFLTDLKERGRKAGETWLKAHFDDVGVRCSVDIRERFL